MIKSRVHRIMGGFFCGFCLLLTGCSRAGVTRGAVYTNVNEVYTEEEQVDIYTSSASAVIEAIDGRNQELSLHLIDRNENRVLSYDGTTIIEDAYGGAMSMAQLKSGDIAKIAYNSELKKLGRITLSEEAWSYEGVERYNLHAGNGIITIGEERYSIGKGVMAFSEGKPIDVAEIIHHDVLSFQGMGRNVMSITVDKGHGYLELTNEDVVLGGWIEIGQSVISQIAPDMLFTVPEGSYKVRLTGQDVDETREVVIERNRETKLDLSDIVIPEPDEGTVIFEITPQSADVYVDNEKVETTYPLKLSLGIHQVMAKASGYDSLAQYIKVEPETITVSMELSEQEEDNQAESDASPGKEETEDGENAKKGKITIQAPADVDVYQDNLYMGTVPVTYEKTPGTHTITLRRRGYITRSYEIVVADDGQDVTYSFDELEPDDGRNTSPSPSASASASPSGSSVSIRPLVPTATPTRTPGGAVPNDSPEGNPSGSPEGNPSGSPEGSPGISPGATPSGLPEASSSASPGTEGSPIPTGTPGSVPTVKPTIEPTYLPTKEPTVEPTEKPTNSPTEAPVPTKEPSGEPTNPPTPDPTDEPTAKPTDPPVPEVIPTNTPGTSETASIQGTMRKLPGRPQMVQEAVILPLRACWGEDALKL